MLNSTKALHTVFAQIPVDFGHVVVWRTRACEVEETTLELQMQRKEISIHGVTSLKCPAVLLTDHCHSTTRFECCGRVGIKYWLVDTVMQARMLTRSTVSEKKVANKGL
jgi:hypothetical protein